MLELYKNKDLIEAGIDEAGRGCLIGRVYTSVVIWDSNIPGTGIKDSKKLSKKKRNEMYDYITKNAIDYAITYADEKEVDSKNILNATIDSMHRALDKLKIKPQHILVDGCQFKTYFETFEKIIDHDCIISGDNKYVSIAAASILSKVSHDRYIDELCSIHPLLEEYGLKTNMGYGTDKHIKSINKLGITKYHRKTYGIVKEHLNNIYNID